MLQQVARVGRLGSLALPSPTLGIRASMINLPMILIEEYTLNPAVSDSCLALVVLMYGHQTQRYYTITTKTKPSVWTPESALLYDYHQTRTI